MAQALGIFTSASGHVASTLGLVNFSPECFTGHPLRPSSSESNPSTIWIAAGVDADGGTPGFGLAGGIMPDARVYSQKAKLLGKTIHQNVSSDHQTETGLLIYHGKCKPCLHASAMRLQSKQVHCKTVNPGYDLRLSVEARSVLLHTSSSGTYLWDRQMLNHEQGVWPGDTNHIVVPQTEKQYGHYTLFSGNRETGNGRDNAVW